MPCGSASQVQGLQCVQQYPVKKQASPLGVINPSLLLDLLIITKSKYQSVVTGHKM
jgi:hypothetical protein